jgi:hypothetical protein
MLKRLKILPTADCGRAPGTASPLADADAGLGGLPTGLPATGGFGGGAGGSGGAGGGGMADGGAGWLSSELGSSHGAPNDCSMVSVELRPEPPLPLTRAPPPESEAPRSLDEAL